MDTEYIENMLNQLLRMVMLGLNVEAFLVRRHRI